MAKSSKKKEDSQLPEETPVTVEKVVEVEEQILPAPAAPEPEKPFYRKEMDQSLSKEERIWAFLEGKTGNVRLNDFLKSLYPLNRFNEPPLWKQQNESKYLGHLLGKMGLVILNDLHLKLGKTYYAGEDHVQKHHDLASVEIVAIV